MTVPGIPYDVEFIVSSAEGPDWFAVLKEIEAEEGTSCWERVHDAGNYWIERLGPYYKVINGQTILFFELDELL